MIDVRCPKNFDFHLLSSRKIQRCSDPQKAKNELYQMAVGNVTREMPGDPKFPLNGLIKAPTTSKDKADLQKYLTQFRQEIGNRIIEKAFNAEGKPCKWWMMFNKIRFVNKTLVGNVY